LDTADETAHDEQEQEQETPDNTDEATSMMLEMPGVPGAIIEDL
jgi:hypothetical protein